MRLKNILSKNAQQGLTLIELLVVVGIVGILAVSVSTVINPIEQIAKVNDAKRKADLQAVKKALEVYYQDEGAYPVSSNDGTGRIIDPITNFPISWGAAAPANGFGKYLQTLPKDSSTGKTYMYSSNGSSFFLFASLERKKDEQLCTPLNPVAKCTNAPGNGLCGGTNVCNYGISSPNVSPN